MAHGFVEDMPSFEANAIRVYRQVIEQRETTSYCRLSTDQEIHALEFVASFYEDHVWEDEKIEERRRIARNIRLDVAETKAIQEVLAEAALR